MITKPILLGNKRGYTVFKTDIFQGHGELMKTLLTKKLQTKTNLAILIKSESPS